MYRAEYFDKDGKPVFPDNHLKGFYKNQSLLLWDKEIKDDDLTLDKEFMEYCSYYGKNYKTSKEYKKRKNEFKNSLDSIKDLYEN